MLCCDLSSICSPPSLGSEPLEEPGVAGAEGDGSSELVVPSDLARENIYFSRRRESVFTLIFTSTSINAFLFK